MKKTYILPEKAESNRRTQDSPMRNPTFFSA